ncbi:MAG: flavin reductase family protein [Syntrophales bacterium LBB04]|nr:flavin reductase family protein [Syntrophales bacterium LBB04]
MEKIRADKNSSLFPMPMVLVGAVVDGRANFMTVGWVSRVNFKPPMMAVALGRSHYTNAGIEKNKAYSVNIPSMDLLEKVDYCGIVSGEKADKSKVFEVFYGELSGAPMIRECPLTFECRLVNTVDMPTNSLFIGEIMGAYTEERYLTDGRPDIKKIDPFTLTMPDNNYWRVGANAGKAWNVGKDFGKGL